MRLVLEFGDATAMVEVADDAAEHDVRAAPGAHDGALVGGHVERLVRHRDDRRGPMRSCAASRSVIAAGELVDDVAEQRRQHGHPITDAAGRPRQGNDQRTTDRARDPRETAPRSARGHVRPGAMPRRCRDFALQQRTYRLRRDVRRSKPRATGRDHDGGAGVDGGAHRGLDRLDIVGHDVPRRARGWPACSSNSVSSSPESSARSPAAERFEQVITAGGHDASRRHSPLRPPDFAISRTSESTAERSTALTMS